jgi:hypothetical protein
MKIQGYRDMRRRVRNREGQMCFRQRSATRCTRGVEGGLSLRFVFLIDHGDEEVAPHQSRNILRAAAAQIKSIIY